MSDSPLTDSPSTRQDFLLELRGICKDFPGVRALHEVDLRARPGTVHALVGENGAGKSTLMKILMGLVTDFTGDIILRGGRLRHRGVREALDRGIAMIHQELTYVPNLTIAQNIFLGKETTRWPFGWIDRQSMIEQTRTLLETLDVDLDPQWLMKDLSVAQQQMVEIAKALSYQAEVMIMDEPTSALSQREVQRLLNRIADLRARGCAVIYITHRLDEVFEIADEVTVLRDGCTVGTYPIGDVAPDQLITLMVGRRLETVFPHHATSTGTEALSVKRLCKTGAFHEISFAVQRGEILGLAGLVGAGRTEVMRCLFGLEPFDSGQVLVRHKPVTIKHPRDAIRQGLGLVCEDRQITGLIPCLSLRQNITLSHLQLCSLGPWIMRAQENRLVESMVDEMSIKATDCTQRVGTLSGGNQQKIVLGKALLGEPDILILDEPTRGIDVGAKAEIYQLMRVLAERGKAIIMVSSDLTEVLGMSDRIIVFREGRIIGCFQRDQATPEIIMTHALAGSQNG